MNFPTLLIAKCDRFVKSVRYCVLQSLSKLHLSTCCFVTEQGQSIGGLLCYHLRIHLKQLLSWSFTTFSHPCTESGTGTERRRCQRPNPYRHYPRIRRKRYPHRLYCRHIHGSHCRFTLCHGLFSRWNGWEKVVKREEKVYIDNVSWMSNLCMCRSKYRKKSSFPIVF